jgi:DNA (cytosine-5)-methyltransferase 1
LTGGIDLAAERAGFESIGQCEFADYPTKVLEKHWPNVPRWRDIRDVTLESVRTRGIRTVDLITGGFPCQPFSVAGKQGGKEDDRYLWPEMLRVIDELRPTWVIGENVVGIVKMALDQVLSGLESKGYTAIPFNVPAAAVDAEHIRKRIFILAHSGCKSKGSKVRRGNEEKPSPNTAGCGEVVAYAESGGVTGKLTSREGTWGPSGGSGWAVEPDVGRVASRIPFRMDRLKCLGNAVVPQQVYPILQAIADIEKEQGQCK